MFIRTNSPSPKYVLEDGRTAVAVLHDPAKDSALSIASTLHVLQTSLYLARNCATLLPSFLHTFTLDLMSPAISPMVTSGWMA